MSKQLVRGATVFGLTAAILALITMVQAGEEKAATAQPKQQHFGGKITAVDVKAGTVTIKHKDETKSFTCAPDCKFMHEGKSLKITDLKVGDEVKVNYTQEGDKLVAHKVGHVNPEKKTEAEGTKAQ